MTALDLEHGRLELGLQVHVESKRDERHPVDEHLDLRPVIGGDAVVRQRHEVLLAGRILGRVAELRDLRDPAPGAREDVDELDVERAPIGVAHLLLDVAERDAPLGLEGRLELLPLGAGKLRSADPPAPAVGVEKIAQRFQTCLHAAASTHHNAMSA